MWKKLSHIACARLPFSQDLTMSFRGLTRIVVKWDIVSGGRPHPLCVSCEGEVGGCHGGTGGLLVGLVSQVDGGGCV